MARSREPLSPEDRALWRKVAQTVRPMKGRSDVFSDATEAAPTVQKMPELHELPVLPVLPKLPELPQALKIQRPPPPPHPEEATLDGQWDRRLRMGRAEPDRVIDLHGMSVEAAHRTVERAVETAFSDGLRLILVVTGKGTRGPEGRRGVIRQSLADWLMMSHVRPLVAAMRRAHPRHGGSGAFYVVLKRDR